jgi:hypothetical protein
VQFSQQRVTSRSSKKLNLINKTEVFLMTAARFYRCGRTTSERLGHAPTLGHVRIGLNMIHGPMGQKLGVVAPLAEKGLCTKMMITAGSDRIWT